MTIRLNNITIEARKGLREKGVRACQMNGLVSKDINRGLKFFK